jgi:integrase/recombinase XerC
MTTHRKREKKPTSEVVRAEVIEPEETTALVSPRIAESARILEAKELLELFLRGRSQKTLENYQFDLRDFADFLEVDSVQDAIDQFMTLNSPAAHALILSYKVHLREKPVTRRGNAKINQVGYAPATINRRIAALKALVKLARTVGIVDWKLDIPQEKARKMRDTSGCGHEVYMKLSVQLEREIRMFERRGKQKRAAMRRRDLAMVRLMYDSALRRKEPLTIDYPEDVHVEDLPKDGKPRILMLGKTREDKEWVTVSKRTASAIIDWLDARGRHEGPLFTSSHPSYEGERLSTKAVNEMLGRLAKRAGVDHVTPHQLRHTSITRALDKTGGDVRRVQKFSRHQKIETLMVYDDLRRDVAGEIAELVSEEE